MNLNLVENVNEVLGKTLTVLVSIEKVTAIPTKYCRDVKASYKWIDEEGKFFETKTVKDAMSRTAAFDYSKAHTVYVSSFIAESLPDSVLKISVSGRLTKDKIIVSPQHSLAKL